MIKKNISIFLFLSCLYGSSMFAWHARPFLWVYWENVYNAKMPAHISLCRKTIIKHCAPSFKIVELDEKNIYTFLPELKELERELNFSRLKTAQKVDFYRIMLLYKYGGIYLDSDIIVMKDLKEVADKLTRYDFVGFGEYNINIPMHNSYGAPQNWVMASRKNGILITELLKKVTNLLMRKKKLTDKQFELLLRTRFKQRRNFNWHDLGKDLIHTTLKPLLGKGYRYYHYPSDVDGTRDKYGRFITTQRKFESQPIPFKDIDQLLFVFISNQYIRTRMPQRYNMTEAELLAEPTNFARLVKKSLS